LIGITYLHAGGRSHMRPVLTRREPALHKDYGSIIASPARGFSARIAVSLRRSLHHSKSVDSDFLQALPLEQLHRLLRQKGRVAHCRKSGTARCFSIMHAIDTGNVEL
jgi:hypothetical protein